MSDPFELYQTRASVRKFRPEPLREGDLDKLLSAAQRAPTDATAQLYSLLRVTDPALRQRLVEITSNAHVGTAAEFFLVLADVHRLRRLVEHGGAAWGEWPRTAAHFAIADAVLAGGALATAAESLGYGICWIGGVLNGVGEVVELCGLPEGVFPVAGLCVGVPDERPAPRPRLARGLVVHENRYAGYRPEQLDQALSDMAPITRSGDWHALLKRYFAQGGTMPEREVGYREALARQGFDPDLRPEQVKGLEARGVRAGSLGELLEGVFALGFRSVQFHHKGHVWVEKEPEAYRGEGRPGEALAAALLDMP